MDDETHDDAEDGFEDHDLDELEPLDLDSLDPDAWRPGIPWRPSISLLVGLLALPLVSIALLGPLTDELRVDVPDQLWAIDLWRSVIAFALIAGAFLVAVVPVAARLAQRRPSLVFRLLEQGLPVGVVMVALLVLAHTALAIAIVLAIERIVLGTSITWTIVIVLISGVASATYVVTSGLGALRGTASDEPAMDSTASEPAACSR